MEPSQSYPNILRQKWTEQHWLEQEIAQWVHHDGSSQQPMGL